MALIISLSYLRIPKAMPTAQKGVVHEISSHYYIVKTKGQKILLYTQQDLNYGDTLELSGKYEMIFTPPSKSSFNFRKYMNRKHIFYSLKQKEVKILATKWSIKRTLYNRIKTIPNSEYLAKVLMNINNSELNSDLSSVLFSSGVIIRSLVYSLLLVLNKFLFEKEINIVEIILYILLFIIFKQYEFYLYLIIRTFFKHTNLEVLDKISMAALIMIVISPKYIFSLSFIITTLYAYMGYISIRRVKILSSMLLIIPIQLITSNSCNLTDIVLFSYYRILNCIAYLLAIFDLMFKSSLSFTFINVFKLNITSFTITGHLPIVLLILWIGLSMRLLQSIKIWKIVSLIIVLLLNQNQLMFNPFLIYTQLYIGQGDAAILKYPFKRDVFLIDTGSKKNWAKLKSHLDYYGIKKIDQILVTHDDEDHSGNVENLHDHYKVSKMILEKGEYRFYSLNLDVYNYEGDDDNDASLITMFNVNNLTYLTLGDISKDIERRFLKDHPDIIYNIVKLGHHGSKTSSSEALLQHEHIVLLLNSSGYKNMYHHPHPSVMKSIVKHQLPFVDTQEYGDIEIKHLFNNDFVSFGK